MNFQLPLNAELWHLFAGSFTLAMSFAALIAAAVWIVRGAAFWRRCIFFLLSLSLVSVVGAYLTGDDAAALVQSFSGAPTISEAHGRFSFYSLVLLISTFLLTSALTFWLERRTTIERNPPDPKAIRIIVSMLILLTTIFTMASSHLGTFLVF